MYQSHDFQEAVDNIEKVIKVVRRNESSFDHILSDAVKDYMVCSLDSILDSQPSLFGETNHLTYFDEDKDTIKLTFENIGLLSSSTFIFSKNSNSYSSKILESLWKLYSEKIRLEECRKPNLEDIILFKSAMSRFFDEEYCNLIALPN